MTPKEYLSRAYYLDMRIRSKAMQIAELETLATKVNAALSPIKVQTSKDNHKMESTVIKMTEYQEELNNDMKKLIQVKRETKEVIDSVTNDEYRVLLELRYLSSMRWEEIAVEMNYSIDHVFRLHRRALKAVKLPAA
jgi:DNA-directed RNA polymerase specialized sigma subunit